MLRPHPLPGEGQHSIRQQKHSIKQQRRKHSIGLDTRRRKEDNHRKSQCLCCDRTFQRQYTMKQHMARQHPEVCTPGLLEKWRDKRLDKIQCPKCGEPVARKQLHRHQRGTNCRPA